MIGCILIGRLRFNVGMLKGNGIVINEPGAEMFKANANRKQNVSRGFVFI